MGLNCPFYLNTSFGAVILGTFDVWEWFEICTLLLLVMLKDGKRTSDHIGAKGQPGTLNRHFLLFIGNLLGWVNQYVLFISSLRRTSFYLFESQLMLPGLQNTPNIRDPIQPQHRIPLKSCPTVWSILFVFVQSWSGWRGHPCVNLKEFFNQTGWSDNRTSLSCATDFALSLSRHSQSCELGRSLIRWEEA